MQLNIYAFFGLLCVLFFVVCGIVTALAKRGKCSRKVAIVSSGLIGVSLLVVMAFCSKMFNSYASYDLDKYADENHFYLGIDVTEDTFEYLKPDFTSEKVSYNIEDAQIAGRINTIGLNNHYRKYIDIGPLRLYRDVYEDTVILSKFQAIQFGLMEATGAEDEKEFIIATDSDAVEALQESVNAENGGNTETKESEAVE